MSPPCVTAIFEGDNGGATAVGVSATEIAVAVPGNVNAPEAQRAMNALFEYFNRTFEFYGRRLRPVYVHSNSFGDPASGRALGAEVAARQVFAAATGMAEWDDVEQSLFGELARRKIITVARGFHFSDRLMLDQLHPYLWTTQPSTEQWQRNVGGFFCRSLAGKPARFAANPSRRTVTRQVGIISGGDHVGPPVQALVDRLRACDHEPRVVTWLNANDRTRAQLRTIAQSMFADGVTTLACVCTGLQSYDIYGEIAKVTEFGPELMIPMASNPNEEIWNWWGFRTAMFGVGMRPKLLPMQAMPWFQALQAVDPTLSPKSDYHASEWTRTIYDQLLVLAAGIQSAGPMLTADTFAAALMSTTFPNAGAGEAPYWQPSVGFGPGDHSFMNDFAIAWWSDEAPTLEPQSPAKGSWCYVNEGARYREGTYPADADALLFNREAPCR